MIASTFPKTPFWTFPLVILCQLNSDRSNNYSRYIVKIFEHQRTECKSNPDSEVFHLRNFSGETAVWICRATLSKSSPITKWGIMFSSHLCIMKVILSCYLCYFRQFTTRLEMLLALNVSYDSKRLCNRSSTITTLTLRILERSHTILCTLLCSFYGLFWHLLLDHQHGPQI